MRLEEGMRQMSNEVESAEVLEQAADFLLVHGRCRGQFSEPTGERCAVGAIEAAAHATGAYWLSPLSCLQRYIRQTWPYFDANADLCLVAQWNDATEDDDEVRDTLLLVAKQLRAEAKP